MGTPGPQKTKRYSLEFKLQAVAMSQQPGVLVQDVAESLCIHPFMLSRWRKQARWQFVTVACRDAQVLHPGQRMGRQFQHTGAGGIGALGLVRGQRVHGRMTGARDAIQHAPRGR